MCKIVIAPDSFKGTLSALEVCEIIKKAFYEVIPDCDILTVPIADGGEGTLDAFEASVGGERRKISVHSPAFEKITADYLVLPSGTAVIEMAESSGLPLVKGNKNPMNTTTLGTGELILHAIESGCKKILIGLGGSATNDGGIGCLSALGFKFLNKDGKEIPLTGSGLSELYEISDSNVTPLLKNVKFELLCDVTNPLCGENGASFVFAPQKGATPKQVKILDDNLSHFADIVERDFNISLHNLPGAGAAGGLGGGLTAFLKAKSFSGADKILETVNFKNIIKNADLIITGEGCLDSQTAQGKVISRVLSFAGRTPCIAIVGIQKEETDLPLCGIYESNRNHLPFGEIKLSAREDLYKAAITAANDFKNKKVRQNAHV